MNNSDALALAKVLAATSGVMTGGGGDNAAAVNTAATTGANAAENNYLKHAERLALANAQKACFTDAASAACATVVALQIKDQLSDKLLSNAAASCKGAECNDVINFIQTQMSSLGCAAPSACPDYNTLSSYLRVAQEKAQGLEPVYPEGWVLDAKAMLDLGKFGVKMLTGATSSKGSLNALGQLAKTDATTVTNNFYREGAQFPQALSTSSGRVIQATEGKTTTVLGTWREDTNSIINNQAGLPESLNYLEPKPGSFNLLNTPMDLYNSLGAEQFWVKVNKPFLEAAIKRGDEIYLATDPTASILARQGGFTREYKLLIENGYVFEPSTGKMVKMK
jgi:filamentous hemagglutinin